MFDFSGLFTVVLYVLQALGLQTIAKRRGIRHAWLAWIPFGSAWILASISDDFKARRTGKMPKLRYVLLVLTVAVAVLSVVTLFTMLATLGGVLTRDELLDFVAVASGQETDLYTPSEEELIEELTEKLEARLDDAALDEILRTTLIMAITGLVLGGVGIAAAVIECICMYNLFESCDPANKLVFFLIGLFVGIWGIFVFVVRNKDLGLPQGLPGGFGSMPPQEPWNA